MYYFLLTTVELTYVHVHIAYHESVNIIDEINRFHFIVKNSVYKKRNRQNKIKRNIK